MKAPYSRDYTPPAPVLQVSLAVPDESPQLGPYPGLVDTGSDGTFIPTAYLEALDVPLVYTTNVRSHLGEALRRVSVHKIDILFERTRLPGVAVVSDDWSSEIIICRDVLNKLQLLLDGPKQITELR